MKLTPWLCVPAFLATLCSSPASAAPLLELSGRARLADGASPQGVKVTFEVDLDRDRKFSPFEVRTAIVAEDGSYRLPYELDASNVDLKFAAFVGKLLTKYASKGFESLLEGGPLPVVVSFERQGYATVTKRLASLSSALNLNVALGPLAEISCGEDACMTEDGAVTLTDFGKGTGIARAFGRSFDPTLHTEQFPGTFSDSENKLLVSSGFAEINVYDAQDKPITSVSSPVSVRFEMNRVSWSTLPDLVADSGKIELPMYSFDRASGEWVREADGELQDDTGEPVPESAVAAIRDGSFEGAVFVAFSTKHFSTFNCDASVERRACVKGRLVDTSGAGLGSVSVEVGGVSYTGSVGAVLTGSDGRFATDVMRSEGADEDADNNGKRGETFRARVQATSDTGIFIGEDFETPREERSVQGASGTRCLPDKCDCFDLGDVPSTFESPRFCHIRVHASFQGRELTSGKGPIASGSDLPSANVRAQVVGGLLGALSDACDNDGCDSGTTDANGNVTLSVPVIGDAPQLEIQATLTLTDNNKTDYYTGKLIVDGCGSGSTTVDGEASIEADHASLRGIAGFIAALEARAVGDGGASGANTPLACGCQAVGLRARFGLIESLSCVLMLAASASRGRRRRAR
jgi:hypothetical protein